MHVCDCGLILKDRLYTYMWGRAYILKMGLAMGLESSGLNSGVDLCI